MDGNGRGYGRWWGRRGLLLAVTAVLELRLGLLGLRCALRHIDDDLDRVVRVVCFDGIARWGHVTSLFAGLVVGVYILRRFPFLRGDTRGVTGVSLFEATCAWVCLRGRLVGDVTTTSTLPLSLKDSARMSLRSRRVLPLDTGGT